MGVWPVEPERVEAYLVKALREAKLETSWAAPDQDFERGAVEFARALIADAAFLEDFEPFVARVTAAGERSALGQLLLKLTSPGVPDVYQGDELWRLSFVDPDNRRPVDWDERRAALRRLHAAGNGVRPPRALRKIELIVRALELRRRRAACFAGAYEPLDAGEGACAFVRGGEVLSVVAVRPSGEERLDGAPGGRWRDVLSGRELEPAATPELSSIVDEDGLALLERA